MKTLEERIEEAIHQLAAFTEEPALPGVTRRPFSKPALSAGAWIADYMRGAGLEVSTDATGAVIGHIKGKSSRKILVGSHYDSVVCGGKYDGAAGIICAVEALREIRMAGEEPSVTIDVIATNDEEGVRFTRGFLTSRALCGGVTEKELKEEIFDNVDHIPLWDVIRTAGGHPEEIAALQGKIRQYDAFLEVHIEQGPILDHENLPLGIVTSIAGIERYELRILGEANHAGTTPMKMRKDAFVSAACMVQYLQKEAMKIDGLVATVGNVNVLPGAVNVVPGEVTASLDVRAQTQEQIETYCKQIWKVCREIAQANGTTFSFERRMKAAPVPMAEELQELLTASVREEGLPVRKLLSGAGHDAQIFGAYVPAAMLFVRSKNGISHQPEEYTDAADLASAVQVLRRTIQRLP